MEAIAVIYTEQLVLTQCVSISILSQARAGRKNCLEVPFQDMITKKPEMLL